MRTIPKILIVEDEPIIATDIELILENLGYEVCGTVDNAVEAMENIIENNPDLVLLDIHIEGDMDGILLAQEIKEKHKIPFIFLTSNADTQTINRVKRTKPSGFIVKPFDEKDLQSNIEIALFSDKNQTNETKEKPKIFFVKDHQDYVKVNSDQVMFVKAEDNYSRLFTVDNSYILATTLKKIETKLSGNHFLRIHRSYLININYIDKIKESAVYIGKHKLPIGRSYLERFYKTIHKL